MKVVVELSGGADSALAAVMTSNRHPTAEFHSLFVDYGQLCRRQEEIASKRIHTKLRWQPENWHKVEIAGLIQMTGGEGLSNIYMPLRNLVLSACAASLADRIGASLVVSGSKGFSKVLGDPYSYKDSTLPFYALLQACAQYAQEGDAKMQVSAVLAEGRTTKLPKPEVFAVLKTIGFTRNDIWSCYTPDENDHRCGTCHNCIEVLTYF